MQPGCSPSRVMDADRELIAVYVHTLREGVNKTTATQTLGILAGNHTDNQFLIAEAGAIPLFVELLRDGSAEGKLEAAAALGNLACNDDNQVLIAEAHGVPPLVDLLRAGSVEDQRQAARALHNISYNNDGNAIAIAAAVGLDALVQLARNGRMTLGRRLSSNAGGPAKRKAALVVAALLGGCVPDSVPRVIMAVIGSYL